MKRLTEKVHILFMLSKNQLLNIQDLYRYGIYRRSSTWKKATLAATRHSPSNSCNKWKVIRSVYRVLVILSYPDPLKLGSYFPIFYLLECWAAVLRIRDPVPFWPLDPESGIRIRFFSYPGSRIPDLGSQIQNPYFWELNYNFLGRKFYT
jgi:hypothetical protein